MRGRRLQVNRASGMRALPRPEERVPPAFSADTASSPRGRAKRIPAQRLRLRRQDMVRETVHALAAAQIGVKTCGKQPMDRGIKDVEAAGQAA